MDKKTARLRRAKRTRRNYIEQGTTRLVIHRTPRHIYAQVVNAEGNVLAAASTVEKAISETVKGTGNVAAAQAVGKAVAERAADKGIEKIAFDRSGFKYHGRVKALADAAREAGLQFQEQTMANVEAKQQQPHLVSYKTLKLPKINPR